MSSHCSRYPTCGCSSIVGTKCNLSESDPRLLQKEMVITNPYAWIDVSEEEKREVERKFKIKGHFKKVRRKVTNLTPPKKKRRK